MTTKTILADTAAKSRVGYIDAMRAFAIFMVVYGHVGLFSLGIDTTSVLNPFFTYYHMPLFFFISGFVTYKGTGKQCAMLLLNNIVKKAQAFLFPPLVFLALLYFIKPPFGGHDDVFNVLDSGYFGGFWFTISLFWILSAYYIAMYLVHKIHIRIRRCHLTALMLFLIFFPLALKHTFNTPWIWNALCGWNTIHNVQYFVFGLIAARYKEKFFAILSKGWVRTIIIISFLLCAVLLISDYYYTARVACHKALWIISTYSYKYISILLTFICFHSAEPWFAQGSKASRFVLYVGRNTLPIYLIHYFFIWHMPEVGAYIAAHDGIVLDFVVVSAISLLLILLSLATAAIVRRSSFLNRLLFAGK